MSFYPQCGEQYFFIKYTCHISRIRWADYGFDIYRENHCDFANLTQDNNLNNKDHFLLYRDMYKHFGNIGEKLPANIFLSADFTKCRAYVICMRIKPLTERFYMHLYTDEIFRILIRTTRIAPTL